MFITNIVTHFYFNKEKPNNKKNKNMSKFNQNKETTIVENMAGGRAYSQSNEMELVSILLTSFVNEQFYRKESETLDKVKELIKKCDKEFVAKAAIYARTEFGMRSITHVFASELAKYINGENARNFYNAIVYRPDDITEIISYHKANNGKLSAAMKKGLALSFGKFDKYQIAKYKCEGKGISLLDAARMVHPKPIAKNCEALELLAKGELKSFDTWESELSKAGEVDASEKDQFKKDVWIRLIKERKIGYFALLRNLRNILEQAPEIIDEALTMLCDENLIKKSLVLPFRFTTAYDEIKKVNGSSQVLRAINKAVDISLNNVPVFNGKTLVVLDVSGSMEGKPAEIGSLFTSILAKSNNADIVTFSNYAQYCNVNLDDSTITLANSIHFSNGGTNFSSAFEILNKVYDRIIILSDMQGWIGYYSPVGAFNSYKQRTGANPFIYSFDLNSYGTLQFPENKVFCLAGFSDKIFEVMRLLEEDKNALINRIKQISF